MALFAVTTDEAIAVWTEKDALHLTESAVGKLSLYIYAEAHVLWMCLAGSSSARNTFVGSIFSAELTVLVCF